MDLPMYEVFVTSPGHDTHPLERSQAVQPSPQSAV